MRDAEIHIFERVNFNSVGAQYIGRLYPYSTYPVFSTEDTPEAAYEALDKLRWESINKYEETYAKRVENMEKARAARRKKKNG